LLENGLVPLLKIAGFNAFSAKAEVDFQVNLVYIKKEVMMIKKSLYLLVLLVLVACGASVEENGEYQSTAEEAVHEQTQPAAQQAQLPVFDFSSDAARVVAIVEEVHPIFIMPGLLPSYYEDRRAEFLEAASQRMSRTAFVLAIQRYYTALHDGHMSLGIVDFSWNWISGGGHLEVPFVYVDGQIFLADSGAQLLYVDGTTVSEIIDQIDHHFYFENEFARALRLPYHVGQGMILQQAGVGIYLAHSNALANPIYITFLENGEQSEQSVRFVRTSPNVAISSLDYIIRYEVMDDVLFISLRHFTIGEHITEVAEAIQTAIDAGITRFIVDLRGNGGGNSAAGAELLMAMGMSLPSFGSLRRASQLAIDQRTQFGVSFSEDADRLEHAPNPNTAANPLGIQLAVLMDNASFSSSTMMATWVQDGSMGVIVGEPSSNAPSAFGDMLTYTLPTSGFNLQLSYTRFMRPDATADQNVLWPDIAVPASQALEAALEYLRR